MVMVLVNCHLPYDQLYGPRQLSSPLSSAPKNNAPGPPPPPFLLLSTATSISIGWEKPTINGGKQVTGYELWMSDLGEGNYFIVYDGTEISNVYLYCVKTQDMGLLSQILESGRQYLQLQVISYM